MHAGAATLAAKACANIVVAKFQGKHTLLAFLDCSKCSARVGHKLAGDRAMASDLQVRLANMILDLHNGDRHFNAHGVVAKSLTGNQGLVARCAFAKVILKACKATVKGECPGASPRTTPMI